MDGFNKSVEAVDKAIDKFFFGFENIGDDNSFAGILSPGLIFGQFRQGLKFLGIIVLGHDNGTEWTAIVEGSDKLAFGWREDDADVPGFYGEALGGLVKDGLTDGGFNEAGAHENSIP